eukprot:1164059-Rhodomonas_salina.1
MLCTCAVLQHVLASDPANRTEPDARVVCSLANSFLSLPVALTQYQAIRSLPAAGSDTGGAAGGLVYKAPLAADTNRFAPNPAFNPYGQNQGFYAGMGARI